jgi:hypothetical protein
LKFLVATFPGDIKGRTVGIQVGDESTRVKLTGGQDPENSCARGSVVIPAFPIGDANYFISVLGDGIAPYATVSDLHDTVDPDEVAQSLIEQYPGLPSEYLEDILTDTLVAVSGLETARVFRVFVTPDSARLQDIDTETNLITIWEDRSAKNYL